MDSSSKVIEFNGDSSEEQVSILPAVRQAVQAFYLGRVAALSQAMEMLNSALREVDGIDYKRFAASQC